MKKILFYGLSNGYGGLESIIINILKYVDKSKLKFDFVLPSNGKCKFENDITSNGGKIYRVTPWGKNPILHRKELKSIFLNKNDYDFVWINTASSVNISMQTVAKKYTQSKIIVHCHGMGFEADSKTKYFILLLLHKLHYKKFLKLTDYAFACSIKSADYLFGQKMNEEGKVKIINNGIEAKQYRFNCETRQDYRKKYCLEDKFVIVHVGRICKVKNHIFLIDIFNEICKQKNNYVLMLVGDGDMKDKIENLVTDYKLDGKVIFMGERNDVPELLQAADIFVLPSLSEGLPLVVIEAQAAGLQSIVSEVVPREAKITDLVEYMSIEKRASCWANAIRKYQEGYKRQDTYDEIVRAGFDINETAEKIEKLLYEVNEDEII